MRKQQLSGGPRHIRNEVYETYRFLLASDEVGITVTDIVLAARVEETYGYENHIEIAYCIEGAAEIFDIATQATHAIAPGKLWVPQRGDRFRFCANERTRLVCVFLPAFTGQETGFAGDQ
jgi:L-ectoine synthase